MNRFLRQLTVFCLGCLCLSAAAQGNEWSWIGGSNMSSRTAGRPGVYGRLKSPAAENAPGGRYGAAMWADNNGDLWLFGGSGLASQGNFGFLNDLWEFNQSTSEWTWMGGSSTVICKDDPCGRDGVYGTLGTPAAGNVPGGRQNAATWVGAGGRFWLFGGLGYDANGNGAYLNDLWQFNPATDQWTWMGGSNTISQSGVYGTLGRFAAGNVPGARDSATVWTGSDGRVWLFGGFGSSNLWANDLWEYDPLTNEWAWMGGSQSQDIPGVYGTLGKAAAGNLPGGRTNASGWADGRGHLWLFGGSGIDINNAFGDLNDLWEFDPATMEWTWMAGSSTARQPGVYGMPGVPAHGNVPGARDSATSWTDGKGHLWLLGGEFPDVNGSIYQELDDLWEFNPSTKQWAWMGGSSSAGNTGGQPGVYGKLGEPAALGLPGGRYQATSSKDNKGHFWLFGGLGRDANNALGYLNDLWEFDLSSSEWTWIGGKSTITGNYKTFGYGVYGTPGKPSAANNPGSRYTAANWMDSDGHLWLFGGFGVDGDGDYGSLNDLWELNPATNEWAWISGSRAMSCSLDESGLANCGQPGVYGNLGTPVPENAPGGRGSAAGWTDEGGNHWLFGGYGFDAEGNVGYLNDLWELNPSTNEWAWTGGSNVMTCHPQTRFVVASCGQPGRYGELGQPSSKHVPGGRSDASSWEDLGGHLWLFGGYGYDADLNLNYLNDLWEFNPSTHEWVWMGGSRVLNCYSYGPDDADRTCYEQGRYGVLGVPASGAVPGSRGDASSWTDKKGHLWLFGGFGYDSDGHFGFLNDLWELNPSTNEWAWIGGSSAVGPDGGQPGVYGELGKSAAGNVPGGRDRATSWTDGSGHLWLFGGYGVDAENNGGELNDLWEFNPSTKEWTWMGGSQSRGMPGVYGVLGHAAAGNVPGPRQDAARWADSSGHLWLFGGSTGPFDGFELNDFWEYGPPTR
jgi:N-acetylneuraminic acid mutarotase